MAVRCSRQRSPSSKSGISLDGVPKRPWEFTMKAMQPFDCRSALLVVATCCLCWTQAARGQFLDASSTITPTGPHQYALTLTDLGDTPIGTFWYAQFAGLNFLKTAPTGVQSPAGWTAIISHGEVHDVDGFGIQWTADTPAARLAAGATLAGFSFDTNDSLAEVTGQSLIFDGFAVGTAVVNSGGPTSDFGAEIDVLTVPEPAALGLIGIAAIALMSRRRA
jgi:hypothetical protein